MSINGIEKDELEVDIPEALESPFTLDLFEQPVYSHDGIHPIDRAKLVEMLNRKRERVIDGNTIKAFLERFLGIIINATTMPSDDIIMDLVSQNLDQFPLQQTQDVEIDCYICRAPTSLKTMTPAKDLQAEVDRFKQDPKAYVAEQEINKLQAAILPAYEQAQESESDDQAQHANQDKKTPKWKLVLGLK